MTHLSPTQKKEYKKKRDSIIEGLALAGDWTYYGGYLDDMPKNALTTPQARDRFDALLNEYIDKAVIEARIDEVNRVNHLGLRARNIVVAGHVFSRLNELEELKDKTPNE